MVLVFNSSEEKVQWFFSECSEPHGHVLAPGFGLGVGSVEAEFVTSLNLPGVRVGSGEATEEPLSGGTGDSVPRARKPLGKRK